MKYTTCKKAELAKFAADRGIQVASTAVTPSKGPLVRDYVNALNQADQEATFRFLDLPPELRTMVYDELLVLQNSFKCHPQILATSHHIRSEATNTLYGNNLFEIKIEAGGVFAHGEPCGRYIPSSKNISFTTLVWPQFLKKAQYLQISMPNRKWFDGRTAYPLGSRIPALGNILYSLACFLEAQNRLRSVEIEFELYPHIGGDKTSMIPFIETACYPLRLLGGKVAISIRDPSIPGLVNLNIKNMPKADSSYADWASKVKLISECVLASGELATQGVTMPFWKNVLKVASLALTSSSASEQVIFRGTGKLDALWMRAMTGALLELRNGMQVFWVGVLQRNSDDAVLQRINELLRLEIDLRSMA